MQVAPTFLEKNAQSHSSALTAFGDLVDNGKESGAKTVRIETPRSSKRVIHITDDGAGMSEGEMRRGLMSIGVTTKTDLSSGKHYGFGGKTAIPRLAEYALVFSVGGKNRHRTVGLISSAFSSAIGAGETKLPLCTWEAAGDTVRTVTTIETPLSMEARGASLKCILSEVKGIPFKSEAVRAALSVYLGDISRPHMYLGVYLLATSRGRICISAVSGRISMSRRYLGGISANISANISAHISAVSLRTCSTSSTCSAVARARGSCCGALRVTFIYVAVTCMSTRPV